MARHQRASAETGNVTFLPLDPEADIASLGEEEFVQRCEQTSELIEAMSREATGFFQTGYLLVDPEGRIFAITGNCRSFAPQQTRLAGEVAAILRGRGIPVVGVTESYPSANGNQAGGGALEQPDATGWYQNVSSLGCGQDPAADPGEARRRFMFWVAGK